MKKFILGLLALTSSAFALTETIPQIPSTILAPAADDYFETGGTTNGSAKILISNFPLMSVNTSALSALNMTGRANGQVAFAEGLSTQGDGRGGFYYYNSSSSATVDGISVLSATGGGRWLLLAAGNMFTSNILANSIYCYQAANFSSGYNSNKWESDPGTVTGSGSLNLSMGNYHNIYVAITGSPVTFTSGVSSQSTENTIVVSNTSASPATIAWPSGWHQMNPLPTTLAAGSTTIVHTVLSQPTSSDAYVYATVDPWASIGTIGASILYGNGSGGVANVTVGSGLNFAAGVLSSTATSTTGSALLYGNGTGGFSNATVGTGLAFSGGILSSTATSTSGSSILYGNGSGGFANVTIGANLTFSGGTLSASGGGGSGYPTAATTMAGMKALTSAAATWVDGSIVHLAGYYNEGDGGGGDFAWQPSDTTADNGGTVIQVTGVSTGRLHRVIPSSNYGSQLPNTTLDIRWFGAIPDVSRDCTPGITAAENSCIFGGSNETAVLYAPAGQYLLQTKLNFASGSAGSFILKGDGVNGTIFVCAFPSTATAMWDLGYFATMVDIENCGFTFQGGSTILSQYLYIHNTHELKLQNIRATNFSGTMFNIVTVSAWSDISHIYTANNVGSQFVINGMGGVMSDTNLGTGQGPPCVMVENCNALNIHDGQWSGGGPYVSYPGASVTSNASTFTITQASHGFSAGDYIYIASAASHAGYINRWEIQSVTTNTITVASTLNPGADTVTFGSLYSVGYFGSAHTGATNDTESVVSGILFNTASSAPTGSSSLFIDGCSGGAVQGTKFQNLHGDFGKSGIFVHGFTTSAYDGTNSYLYTIASGNAYGFTFATCNGQVNASAMTNGQPYCIQTTGTTNWTSLGASSTAVGTVFTYNGNTVTGSGGIAATCVAHSMKAGGWAHVTGSTYQGFWKISSVGTYTLNIVSTANLGTAITQPLEGDIITSSATGLHFNHCDVYCHDDFGGIRVEGAANIEFVDCAIANPASTSDTGTTNSVVVTDGGYSIPMFDIAFIGCGVTVVGQSGYVPAYPHTGFTVSGTGVYSLMAKANILTGSVTPWVFVNGATPNSCNLDTDYFAGQSVICNIGASGQSFNTGTQAPVSWDHASWDPQGMWQGPSNPVQIIPPTGVRLVKLTGKVHWNTSVSPQYVVITQNGTVTCGSVALANQPYNSQATVDSGVIAVNPGDFFRLECYQTSGSTQTLANSAETALTLTVIK